MEPFVPLISGTQTGPLGIAHLPRFWLKMRAFDAGVLPEGYRHGNGGSDEAFLTGFGVDPAAFAAFIKTREPDYLALEVWLRDHAATLAPDKIQAFAELVGTMQMPEPRKSEWKLRFGIPPDAPMPGVELNQLDDWDGIHQMLVAPGPGNAPVVPAIGSGVAGPLGVVHFPRMWLKHLLHGVGRLADGYRLCRGFDRTLASELGFECDAFTAFAHDERPGYLAAEAWVREHAANLKPDVIAALNARIIATKLPDTLAHETRAKLGLDMSFERSIPMNDLDDWFALHVQLKAIAHG